MRLFLNILLLFFVTTSIATASRANELNVRNIFKQPTSHAESFVFMLILAEAAEGNSSKADCIKSYYFGSPMMTRAIINKTWRWPDRDGTKVLFLTLKSLCGDGQKAVIESNDNLWDATEPSDVEITSTHGILADAATRALIWRAAAQKRSTEANCILSHFNDGALYEELARVMRSTQGMTAIYATYQSSQNLCSYPSTAPIPANLTVPTPYNVESTARERILAIKDLEHCDQNFADVSQRKICIETLFDQRSESLFEIALATNSKEIQEAEARLAAIRAAAWQLPDGRNIFKDEQGDWHFTDGRIVPNYLSITRIPPN